MVVVGGFYFSFLGYVSLFFIFRYNKGVIFFVEDVKGEFLKFFN